MKAPRETDDEPREQHAVRTPRARGGQFNFKLSPSERQELRAVCRALDLPDESSTIRFLVKREARALGVAVATVSAPGAAADS